MKILAIGHGRESYSSGWANAFRSFVLAADSVGIDVVVRNVKLGLPCPPDLPKRFLELEDKDSVGCDICIQNLLPHLYDYNSGFKKNICIYNTETDNFKYSRWPEYINTMDAAWVPNAQMIEASRNSGVRIPIDILHHPVDVTKFKTEVKKLDIEPIRDTFNFYFVGDLNRRKHLTSLIVAFHTEFSPYEPVSLVIKTSQNGLTPQQCTAETSNICNEIKKNIKLYPNVENYRAEIIISEHLKEEDLWGLHKACHCFVMPSFGEGWCLPAMDALGFGNPVIATEGTGMDEFVQPMENGWLVSARKTPCTGMMDTFPELFTGFENWLDIDIPHLRQCMRAAFEEYNQQKDWCVGFKSGSDCTYRSERARETVDKFSYEVVGNRIKELLCQL